MEKIIKKWERILEKDSSKDIIYDREVLKEMLTDFKGEQVFTLTEIEHLQSEIFKITGRGKAMKLFNKMLGVNTGS